MLDKAGIDRTYIFQNSDPLLKKMGPLAEVREGSLGVQWEDTSFPDSSALACSQMTGLLGFQQNILTLPLEVMMDNLRQRLVILG